MISWTALAAVALGGAAGSTLRYVVGALLVQRFGAGFPYGTLLVNMSGCFLIGIIAEIVQSRLVGSGPFVRVFLIAGVLGGYTTFSSFAYESLTMLEEGAPLQAAAYAAGSVAGGIALAFAGALGVRLLHFPVTSTP